MSELSIEYQSVLEREKELAKRYEDLFNFLQMHVKHSQVSTHMTTTVYADWQSHDPCNIGSHVTTTIHTDWQSHDPCNTH